MQWTRYPTLARDHLRPAAFRTELEVRKVTTREVMAARKALGDTMWGEYERSAGKTGFHHFMALDGARPVASGALAAFEGLGYLTAAATAENDRQRGAQSALIAKRIDYARVLGCTALTVETLTMLKHSMRNLERADFRVAYEKEVYQWSRDNDADVAVAKPPPRGAGSTRTVASEES
jgi:GNAT superfamily N-acetyltransferase